MPTLEEVSVSAPEVRVTAEDVERTVHATTVAQWGVAVVVMGGSMTSGGFTFAYLGEPWPLGVVTALAVDLALAAWLRIASRLQPLGVTSLAGWALEATTAAMTLFLNIGAAVFHGINQVGTAARVALAVAHSFLPVVLVLITVAGSDAQRKLLDLRREREASERASREAVLAARRAEEVAQRHHREEVERRRANGELVDAQAVLTRAQELRRDAEREARAAEEARQAAAQARSDAEAEVAVMQTVRGKLAASQSVTQARVPPGGTREKTSAEARRQWVRRWYAETGELPSGPQVDREFGTTRNGHLIVGQVAAEIAEEQRRMMHSVQGGRQ